MGKSQGLFKVDLRYPFLNLSIAGMALAVRRPSLVGYTATRKFVRHSYKETHPGGGAQRKRSKSKGKDWP
jgi:hypothetical protein